MNLTVIVSGVFGSRKKRSAVCYFAMCLLLLWSGLLKNARNRGKKIGPFSIQKADFLQYQLRTYWFSHSEPKGEL